MVILFRYFSLFACQDLNYLALQSSDCERTVNNTACVDDIALVSENPDQAQALISMAYDYAYMEGYELQPTKSVVLNISQKQNN